MADAQPPADSRPSTDPRPPADSRSSADPGPYTYPLRVRYAECDMQGVVFNAQYLAYFDNNMTELWRTAFGSYDVMLQRGVDIVVAEARVRFRGPARFDEQLTMSIAVARLGRTSVTTAHRVLRDDELLAEGELRHVFVDAGTHRKTDIPDWVREGLARWTLPETGG